MITLEDLKRLRYYDTVIQSGEERIADLRRKAEGLTRDLNGMPRASSHSDKMAEYMVKLEGLEEELGRQLVEMLELEQRVAGEVERLPSQQALIMRLRYLSVRNGTIMTGMTLTGLKSMMLAVWTQNSASGSCRERKKTGISLIRKCRTESMNSNHTFVI